MKYLITGASGFIGGALVDHFRMRPDTEILATGRAHRHRWHGMANVRYASLDLTEDIPDLSCDLCIHAAGLADDHSDEQSLFMANVRSTEQLISALKNCRCIVFISSASVYDFADGQVKKEDDSGGQGISSYGASKLEAEHRVARSGIPSVYILRPRGVYGPGDRHLLPRIRRLIKGNWMLLPGQLNVKSSLTHVSNLIQAVEHCLRRSETGVHRFNIADKDVYTLRQVFGCLGRGMNNRIRLIPIPLWLVKGWIQWSRWRGKSCPVSPQAIHYLNHPSVLDISRACSELAYAPQHSFPIAMERREIIGSQSHCPEL